MIKVRKSCPVCNSKKWRKVGVKDGIVVFSCGKCHFVREFLERDLL